MSSNDPAAPDVFAEVVLALPVSHSYHYRIPAAAAGLVARGSVVAVPVGRRFVTGYVVALDGEAPAGIGEIKPIREVLLPGEAIPEELFDLAASVADYYLSPLGEVLRAALPASNVRSLLHARLSGPGTDAVGHATSGLKARDRALLEVLAARGRLSTAALKRSSGDAGAADRLRRLESEGYVTLSASLEPAARAVHAKLLVLDPEPAPGATEAGEKLARRSPAARRLLDLLARQRDAVSVERARAETGASAVQVRRLQEVGLVRVVLVERERDLARATGHSRRLSAHALTAGQAAVSAEVSAALEKGGFASFLLHGITGSGKTLVYLDLIAGVIERGQAALLLVPEIGLTPLLSRELRGRFGDQVAVLHSALSAGERFDAWRRIRAGRSRVVFGARSAVFAPAPGLGLIIVDEEHDPSYKQADRPHYHARDVAVLRAKLLGIPVLLGSATPALESYENARRGRYRLLELNERAQGAVLPEVEVVDLRREFDRAGARVILASRLAEEIDKRLLAGEQAMLLLNRRGYANFLLCRECGQRAECPNCSVAFAYHLREDRLKCHRCGHERKSARTCLACQGTFLHLVGHGTEKVEAALRERFPRARIARLDRDTARRKGDVERLLQRFERRELDLLIGTQMVAKGHDFPNVTLVGVISVDAMLALPDFRATERAFALLTQVAGRAGRGDRPGQVILQTYYPDNEAVQLACTQDYRQFFAREMKIRRLMRYPPTRFLVNLIAKGPERPEVEAGGREVAQALRAAAEAGVDVLGPAMAPLERLKGDFRVQVLLRSQQRRALRATLERARPTLARRLERGSLDLDIDPQDLL